MPTKRQLEIREWCLSNLAADEKLLWYGEAEISELQRISTQISKFVRSINFDIPNRLAHIACAGFLSFAISGLGIVTIGLGLLFLKAMSISGVLVLVGGFAMFCLGFYLFPSVLASLQNKSQEGYIAPKPVIVQTVAYAITNYRILSFDQKPYSELPLEELDESILSKPKDGLCNISLYPISKSKNPQPSYILRAIPEDEAQDAYLILREARDYAERVRERDVALEKQKRL